MKTLLLTLIGAGIFIIGISLAVNKNNLASFKSEKYELLSQALESFKKELILQLDSSYQNREITEEAYQKRKKEIEEEIIFQ